MKRKRRGYTALLTIQVYRSFRDGAALKVEVLKRLNRQVGSPCEPKRLAVSETA